VTTSTWQQKHTREIAQLLKDIDICMLVTRIDGTLRGRPMSNNGKVEFDGDSWFFSYRDSGKVREIADDPAVELAYIATDQGTWISVEGTAEMVEDDARKRELWDDGLAEWFTEGPDNDRVVLVKVRADRIHGWANGEEFIADPDNGIRRIES
jgi:general stress protein 26